MKTTIELLEDLKVEAIYCKHSNDEIGNHHYEWSFELDKLEAFRLAVEADFLWRCECVAEVVEFRMAEFSKPSATLNWINPNLDIEQKLYTLPKETK